MKPGTAQLFVGLIMLASAVAAMQLKPTEKLAANGPRVHLATMIPHSFRGWHAASNQGALLINPKLAEKVGRLYDQTLSRTYVNAAGEAVMLSIAYGGNQTDQSLQVHRPEFCYTSQGFRITKESTGRLRTSWGVLPVKRLVATRDGRVEPITYWITVGDKATLPGIGRKLQQLKYGLTGRIPDGMLIRVSSIDDNPARAYKRQESFIESLIDDLADADPASAKQKLAHLGFL